MKTTENSVVKIENIVASGSVAEAINLKYISNNITDCVLDTRRFPGAVYHMQNPKSAALIFESGRIVITGVRKSGDMAVALQKLLTTLKSAKITCHDKPQVSVKNIICSYNLGNPCNLNRIMIALMDTENIEYEPEVFPGLVCRISDPKMVFLLFSSGKIIITGGTNMDDVEKGVEILKKKLNVAGLKH